MNNGNTRARRSELPMVLGGMAAGALSSFMAFLLFGSLGILPGILLGASMSIGAAEIDRRYAPAMRAGKPIWTGVLGVSLIAGVVPMLLIGAEYYLVDFDFVMKGDEIRLILHDWRMAPAAVMYAFFMLPVYSLRQGANLTWKLVGGLLVLCGLMIGFVKCFVSFGGDPSFSHLHVQDIGRWLFASFLIGGLGMGVPFALLWTIATLWLAPGPPKPDDALSGGPAKTKPSAGPQAGANEEPS